MAAKKKTRRSLRGTPSEHRQDAKHAVKSATAYLKTAQGTSKRDCSNRTRFAAEALYFAGIADAERYHGKLKNRGTILRIRKSAKKIIDNCACGSKR